MFVGAERGAARNDMRKNDPRKKKSVYAHCQVTDAMRFILTLMKPAQSDSSWLRRS